MFDIAQYPLPYDANALQPYISEETINFHYGKHLAGYIKKLNDLIQNTKYQTISLDDIITQSAKEIDKNDKQIFNNAAQIFNHNFFFNGMCMKCTTKIPDEIINAFGSKEKFFDAFKSSATTLFGSGYTWLVRDNGTLKIINTSNADTPIIHGMTPILTLDVWEHAYYLDYQNKRADFIDAFLNDLVNWDFVAENLNK
jgi:Fe-Mn family superoxide dismutase